jgi:DNA polymerase-1
MNIKFYEKDGFEADDLAGTMTKVVSKNVDVFLFTADKDYAQLVTDNVFLFRQLSDKKYHKLDKDYILKQYSIKNTDQVRDLLALEGDTADNIPGIHGIGKKIAQKLLDKYSSVENIIENVNSLEVSDTIKDNIKNNKYQLVLSKKLVTITTNVDFNFDINDCTVKSFNNEELTKIFCGLEFNSFLKKISLYNKENRYIHEQPSLF